MDIETAQVRIEGVSPLLMHSAALANPTNEWTMKIKEITSKTKKKRTEQDELDLIKYEFQGGLYFDDVLGPVIPSECLEGCIRDGAKAKKKGVDVTAGLQVDPDKVKLLYDGPRTRNGLFENTAFIDIRPVKLQGKNTIMRTRARFEKWSLDFSVRVFTDTISLETAKKALVESGRKKGLGDYRPKFGRFVLEKFEVK